jgi:cellulose synthase/poly-beta-1,6-N-acetylglucosamine synthase-like glycosyltransferase
MDLRILRDAVSGAAALASLPGTVELGALTLAGLLPARRREPLPAFLPDVHLAVIIPAHNERESIGSCLDSLLAANHGVQAAIVVVADNCSDETAAIARERGVEVLERFSVDLRGKGFALDHAFRELAARQYDAYVIVDADSLVPANFLASFRTAFAKGVAAAQCR